MRRKAVLIIVLIITVIGIGIFWFASQRSDVPKTIEDNSPVKVSNLDRTPTKLTDNQAAMIKASVSNMVVTKHGQSSYTATFRDGSYNRTVTSQGGIITTLLVDVAEIKETYLVTWTGGDNATNSTSYVRCAPESDQIVHPSVCKELAND
jgi:hypothetical protein